ncbi:MAG: release factor glutamine methyltransferase [Chlamydiales bacterium]|jgi:release factor glutamine methyltransferase
MKAELAQPRTVADMVQMARAFLERKGCEEARLEAELLVASALSIDRLGLFLSLDRPLQAGEIDAARDLLVRRGRREPVAYITGMREFYGRDFEVDRNVLIPRPETELLVDQARTWAAERDADATLSVLDMGTGSGCLATTLALELPQARVVAVDISEPTLAVARANAARLAAEVDFRLGDGFAGLDEAFDLIVCNPPYVDPAELEDLAPEVRDYEPHAALFAPAGDPDHWVRQLIEVLPRLLAPAGLSLVELGIGQAERVLQLAEAAGFEARVEPDLAGIERVLQMRGR